MTTTTSRSMRTNFALASAVITASVVAMTTLVLLQRSAAHDQFMQQTQTLQSRLALSSTMRTAATAPGAPVVALREAASTKLALATPR